MKRCNWSKLVDSKIYQQYHDSEWGVPVYDDQLLFEMFVLETFHCGLSWLIILEKRVNFKCAFDDFDVDLISRYDDVKVNQLLLNDGIVKHRGKIEATINNAKCFIKIQNEFGSFSNYIWSFTKGEIVYKQNDEVFTHNMLSDVFSKDLKKRGFKFMGSVTAYSYLEAVGVMNNHSKDCFLYKKSSNF